MTRAQIVLLSFIPVAYFVGSIPFGLLVGFWRGIDVRQAGSGNIGATNVGRLLGGRYFALVFVLDLLKGLLPTLAGAIVLREDAAHAQQASTYLLWILVAFAAIAGHMFSLFLAFKGGKGVATSLGAVLGMFPYFTLAGVAGAGVWLVLFLLTRYVSVASMIAAVCFPVAYLAIGLSVGWPVFGTQLPLLAFAFLIAAMILIKHRANLARLRAGTEHRIGRKEPQAG